VSSRLVGWSTGGNFDGRCLLRGTGVRRWEMACGFSVVGSAMVSRGTGPWVCEVGGKRRRRGTCERDGEILGIFVQFFFNTLIFVQLIRRGVVSILSLIETNTVSPTQASHKIFCGDSYK
jgi:hypothetical protein